MMILHRDPELPEIVRAARSPSRLARRLDRRQQQRNQRADDRNHHQQLDQRKTARSHDPAIVPGIVCAVFGVRTRARAKETESMHFSTNRLRSLWRQEAWAAKVNQA